jgi:hypothetical protein
MTARACRVYLGVALDPPREGAVLWRWGGAVVLPSRQPWHAEASRENVLRSKPEIWMRLLRIADELQCISDAALRWQVNIVGVSFEIPPEVAAVTAGVGEFTLRISRGKMDCDVAEQGLSPA